ncbi:MAG: VOC family protein [Brevibacterium sp.]
MALVWEQSIIDARDPHALGRWWAEALGWVIVDESETEIEIRETPERLPGLIFGIDDDPKTVKNRMHLDFRPDDQAAEVARFLSLGAKRVDIGQTGDEPWVVLADPEGNEFCILSSRRA